MPGVLIREVQIRRDEVLRQLPDAIGSFTHEVDGDDIVLRDGDKEIELKLVYDGEEHVGPMDLPIHQVHFIFKNMTDEQARAFMETWDAHKMRMGGG